MVDRQTLDPFLTRIRAALRWRAQVADNESELDIDAPGAISATQLIAQLGLIEDRRPVCDYDWWRRPNRIVITEVSTRRLAWLQEVAPRVEVVAVKWSGDMAYAAVGADAIVGWCTDAMLARADELRWIQLGTAGIEDVLRMPQLQARKVLITNLQRAAGPVIAEHAMAMLFALARDLPRHLDHQRQRNWSTARLDGSRLFSLAERTLLVAGLGGIGSEVARLGHGLGMRTMATRARSSPAPSFVDRVGPPEAIRDMAREADVVVNTLPLTKHTERMFDSSTFAAMKRGAIFVNVARGRSVETGALVEALQSGHLGGAALDVTDPEPLPRSHPLWKMPNVVITPHVAGWGSITRAREWLVMKENVRRYVAGEPMLSVVDVGRGY